MTKTKAARRRARASSEDSDSKPLPTILREQSLNAAPTPATSCSTLKVKQEVIDISDLDGFVHLSVETRQVSRVKREGSVMSVQDAKSTVDAFFADQQQFTSDKENKLRFWQSLCIEFGLVRVEESTESDLSVIKEEGDRESDSSDEPSDIDSPSRTSNTDARDLPELPTTLKKVKKLLKAKAHVNLKDYMAERGSKSTTSGQPRDLSHLVFSSSSAMMKYTRKKKRFAKITTVRKEWLDPLLKTFF